MKKIAIILFPIVASLFHKVTSISSNTHNSMSKNSNSVGDVSKTSPIACERYLVDSITIKNVDQYYKSICFSETNKSVYIRYLSTKKDKVYTIGMRKKELIDSIPFPKILRSEKTEWFVNAGKIYILAKDQNCLYQFSKNTMVNKFKFPSTKNVSFYSIDCPLSISNGEFMLNRLPHLCLTDPLARKEYFKSSLLTRFTLKNHEIKEEESFLQFPEIYRKNYFNEKYPVTCKITEDSIAYLFSLENKIHYYNIKTKTHTEFPIRNLAENKRSPFIFDSLRYPSYQRDYNVFNDEYGKVLYDKISGNYLVIQFLKPERVKPKKGEITLYEDKPALINVVDRSLKVTRKILFHQQSDNMFCSAYYFNNKLYLPQFSEDDENKIKIYEIK